MTGQVAPVSPQTTAYEKFASVINSCETQAHLLTAHRLIERFKARYPDEFNYLCNLRGILRVKQLKFVEQFKA